MCLSLKQLKSSFKTNLFYFKKEKGMKLIFNFASVVTTACLVTSCAPVPVPVITEATEAFLAQMGKTELYRAGNKPFKTNPVDFVMNSDGIIYGNLDESVGVWKGKEYHFGHSATLQETVPGMESYKYHKLDIDAIRKHPDLRLVHVPTDKDASHLAIQANRDMNLEDMQSALTSLPWQKVEKT